MWLIHRRGTQEFEIAHESSSIQQVEHAAAEVIITPPAAIALDNKVYKDRKEKIVNRASGGEDLYSKNILVRFYSKDHSFYL